MRSSRNKSSRDSVRGEEDVGQSLGQLQHLMAV